MRARWLVCSVWHAALLSQLMCDLRPLSLTNACLLLAARAGCIIRRHAASSTTPVVAAQRRPEQSTGSGVVQVCSKCERPTHAPHLHCQRSIQHAAHWCWHSIFVGRCSTNRAWLLTGLAAAGCGHSLLLVLCCAKFSTANRHTGEGPSIAWTLCRVRWLCCTWAGCCLCLGALHTCCPSIRGRLWRVAAAF